MVMDFYTEVFSVLIDACWAFMSVGQVKLKVMADYKRHGDTL